MNLFAGQRVSRTLSLSHPVADFEKGTEDRAWPSLQANLPDKIGMTKL
ncbi:MAG: hypothetical protein K0R68_3110, partial [Mycobacterium sp.]|nr:hypothetical protein [Mycobacterium sp.]